MKKIIFLICMTLMCIHMIYPINAYTLSSQYAYVYDPNTQLVYLDVKSNDKIYPASMTKIVTLMCALDKIEDLQQEVQITYEDIEGLYEANASVCGFGVNEIVSVEDLLYGVLLPSGADACNALARITYGSCDALVDAMNKKVQDLNLKNTHFTNVTGLHDDNHYTTCYDMSRLLENALQNKQFKDVFETRSYTSSSKAYTWLSSLKRGELSLNRDTDCIDGGKSGFTYEARLTYASSMTVDHHKLICIVADADYNQSNSHINDTLNIYHDINDRYHNVNVFNENDVLQKLKIKKTKYKDYDYCIDKSISLLLEKQYNKDDLNITINIQDDLVAPIQENTRIGELIIEDNQKVLLQYDLFIHETIKPDFIGLTIYYSPYIIAVTLALTVIIIIKKQKNKNMG